MNNENRSLRKCSDVAGPEGYRDFLGLLHGRFDDLSKTSKKIAVYITQNPDDVAMLSVNAIANRCGVHVSSFVRFAQAMGYTGFKDLRALFHARLSSRVSGHRARLETLSQNIEKREEKTEHAFLRDLALRDIAALQEMIETIGGADLQRTVRILERADTIYLIGQLRSAPVVEHLRYALTLLEKRVVPLDGGFARRMAATIRARDALLAVSFRDAAAEVVTVAETARSTGVPVIAITDTTLAPVAKFADVVFPIPEHGHAFSRSLAAPICLVQGLATALAAAARKDLHAPQGDGS